MAFYVCANKEKGHYSELMTEEQSGSAKQHTINPITTQSSVVAVVFADGVIIGSDRTVCYGGMSRYSNVQRVHKITDSCAVTSSGEYADFQELVRLLEEMTNQSFLADDGIGYTPRDYGNYIAQLQYHFRNKMNPLFLSNVVGGIQNGKPYLALIDLYGTYIEKKTAATGFGTYLCDPILDEKWNENCSEEQAKAAIMTCFEALFYRDARAHEDIQLTVIDRNGVRIEEPRKVESKWDFQGFRQRANEKIHNQ